MRDELDLRPNRPDPYDPYNIVVGIIGPPWHEGLGATEMEMISTWTSVPYP